MANGKIPAIRPVLIGYAVLVILVKIKLQVVQAHN